MVHSQCEFSTFFLARRIAEELNVPLIHTYHTVYEDYTHYFSPSVRLGRRAVAALSRWVAARTDCMIAPTGKVRTLLQGYGVRTPVFVVPSGIDLRRFQRPPVPGCRASLLAALDIPRENLVLVSVGRLAAEKNLDELLRFRAAMGDQAVTLLLVGDGPYRAQLEAADLGLRAPQVVFAGMVPPQQVAEWYQLGDLFVSASSSETQGLTYVEALAAGVPALCRADPCLSGVIRDGENGWQFRDFSDFMSKLRRALSEQAAASARDYSAEEFARRVEAIYLAQIARRSGREEVSA